VIAYTYVKTFFIILWLTPSFFWLTNIYAQISLPPIVVTASRLPQPSTEIGREIEIIEAEEIRQLPVHSVDELLEYFSSIDVRNRGISGIQSDFSLRGSSFEQVLFLINGMPINDPQTGHHHGDIPITLNEIDRIEVVLGGASALYGHGGFGGVINIITKKQTKPKIKVKYAHGEYDYNLEKIGLTTPTWQDNQLSLNWERQLSNGYHINTDFDTKLGNLSFNSKNWQIFMGFSDKRFGANSFYTPKYPWQWERTQTQLFLTKTKFQIGNIHFQPAFIYRRHDDHFFLDRNNPDFYQNHHHTHVYNFRLPFNKQIANIKIAGGTEFSREDIKSNSLGSHFRWHEGIFLSLSPALEKINTNLDLRLDHYSEDLGTEFSHNLSFAYKLRPDLKLRWATGRSFRIPSFTELYYQSPANIGNPALRAEHAWHLESGIDIFKSKWQAGATIFYRWGRDIIDWVMKKGFWQAENLTRVNTFGLSLNFTIWWDKHSLRFDYTYLNQSSNPQVYAKYLNYLRHKTDFIFLSHWPGKVDTSLVLSYQKRLDQTAYPLLDIKIKKIFDYSHGKCSIFIEGKNLLGADYKDIAGVPMPDVWIWGGIEIEIF